MIIASSPIIHEGNGVAARRIVLRDLGNEFVVHAQRFYEDGSTAFDHGNYFSKDSLLKAWNKFTERASSLLEYPVADLQSDVVRFKSVLSNQ